MRGNDTDVFPRGDFHFYVEMQATNLIQLCHALVIELGIGKPPGAVGAVPRSLISDAWSTMNRGKPKISISHSLSDKRALLGCWYITSTYVLQDQCVVAMLNMYLEYPHFSGAAIFSHLQSI
jgi:hypothetical protein